MKLATHASLFSGIGGVDLGLELAGLRTLWQSEVEPFCLEVLAGRFPEARRVGSAAELPDDLERPDLLSGGFPCQPVSDAGLKLAQDDPRWLWPLFRAAVERLRPSVVLAENVRGLRARGLGDVVGDLADLGYAVEWDLIPAAAVGAPHLRERFLIVGWEDGQLRNLFGPQARQTLPQDWEPEPDVPRLLREVSRRRERLTALGNAVVPRVAWWVGRRILEAEPDEMVWGRAIAERTAGEWLTPAESFLGDSEPRPFPRSSWPNAGQVVEGRALSAARTVDRLTKARWKTPTSAPWSGGGGGGPLYMDVAEGGRGDLIQVARGNESPSGHFATPKASPSGPDYARAERDESGGDDLATQVARQDGPAGGLNPAWVEWLMWFPPSWTDV